MTVASSEVVHGNIRVARPPARSAWLKALSPVALMGNVPSPKHGATVTAATDPVESPIRHGTARRHTLAVGTDVKSPQQRPDKTAPHSRAQPDDVEPDHHEGPQQPMPTKQKSNPTRPMDGKSASDSGRAVHSLLASMRRTDPARIKSRTAEIGAKGLGAGARARGRRAHA